MSAVASEVVPVSVAVNVPVAVPAGPSAHELEMAEQKRWMTWFGLPPLFAALFVGLVFGTGQEWYLGLAIAAIVCDVGVLCWLAMSSDTNALIEDRAVPQH